ncbi:hypothetical protein J6524_01425 [Bradyrhizobium sp. WSM 1738]|uniref:hypothetical protein n=1 Tax=Bradyrhizobium hereditatis TaxID=2821405 RepID=UPI001CE297A2|nr:hypothetical protein [Bradyrhizobium hereditatis]MCA6113592.1 hypothetical protein [Bradyrhizobium hereditatis]
MNRLYTLASVGFCVASAALTTTSALAFPTEEVPKTEPEYIAKVKTAAPASVVNNATITMPQPDGSSKTIQTGSNGFTCFIGKDGTPECDDENAMEWRKALQAKQDPPNKIGLIFMLAGDTGTSNHDPAERHTHKHWVQTGPHVMIVGGAAREMLSPYPRDLDVKDPTQPYVMFPGKPSEHLMIPVHSEPITTGSAR